MNKYVLDAELRFRDELRKGTARNWGDFLGQDAIIITCNGQGSFMKLEDGSPVQFTSGIIVVHRPEQEHLNALAIIAKEMTRLFVLIVSGSPSDTSDVQSDWCYRMSTPLKNPDPAFASRFATFLDDFERNGRRKANLLFLEPTAVPEAILAYVLAMQYQIQVPNIRELCAAADTCYESLQPYAKRLAQQNKTKFPAGFIFPAIENFESAPEDTNGVRFKAMRIVIELLREDL